MLFVVVALFGMLAYAFMQSTRTSTGWLSDEQDKAAATSSLDCTNSVNMALKRLESRGCGADISYRIDGTNAAPNAPTDGSCSIFHPNGGSVKPCNNLATLCDLATLAVGDTCGDAVYVGVFSGDRVYVSTDSSIFSWNNGSGGSLDTGATSETNGTSNTNILAALVDAQAPYRAAQYCRSKGPEWYLPSHQELLLVYTNKDVGDLDGLLEDTVVGPSSEYWSSTQSANHTAASVSFRTGSTVWYDTKNNTRTALCMRTD